MIVKELKELVKLTDISNLSEGTRYLVRIPKHLSMHEIECIGKYLDAAKINAVVTFDDISFTPLVYNTEIADCAEKLKQRILLEIHHYDSPTVTRMMELMGMLADLINKLAK